MSDKSDYGMLYGSYSSWNPNSTPLVPFSSGSAGPHTSGVAPDPASSSITVNTAGVYFVACNLYIVMGDAGDQIWYINVAKNGTLIPYLQMTANVVESYSIFAPPTSCSGLVYCDAGDVLTVVSTSGPDYPSNIGPNTLTVFRVSNKL